MTYIHIISSPFPHCTVTAAIGVDKVRASGRQRSQVNFQSSKGHRSRWNGLHAHTVSPLDIEIWQTWRKGPDLVTVIDSRAARSSAIRSEICATSRRLQSGSD